MSTGTSKNFYLTNKRNRMICMLNQSSCATNYATNQRLTKLGKCADLILSTARKSGNISSHTEKLFSSDTRQSMKRRIATARLSKIYIARCGYTWLDESKWPQEWSVSQITIIYLKISSEKMKSFCLHKTGF